MESQIRPPANARLPGADRPVDGRAAVVVGAALATDCNPGSSPLTSLLLTMNMACTLSRLSPDEAARGVSQHAARTLGLSNCAVIVPGRRDDLAVWDVETPAEQAYHIGFNPLHTRIFGGRAC